MNETGWWWIRHTPMIRGNGTFPEMDAAPPPLPAAEITALASRLPDTAHWIASPRLRTRTTAEALMKARGLQDKGPAIVFEPDLVEQDFGDWHGRSYDDIYAETGTAAWAEPATLVPPGGESFAMLCKRTANFINSCSESLPTNDIIVVAHAGTIRGALAQALDLAPARALAIEISPLSLTRIDRFPGSPASFAVHFVNRLAGPW